MLLSLSKLSELTGKTYRTVRAKIGDLKPVQIRKNAHLFESKIALPLIYGAGQSDGPLDAGLEKARLDQARRIGQELKNAEMERVLVPADEVTALWSRMIGSARAKLLTIPHKCAPAVLAAETEAEAAATLKNAVHEALRELHRDMTTALDGLETE